MTAPLYPIPTTIAAAEEALQQRLREHSGKLPVSAWPAKIEDYQLRHQKGEFLVAYRGGDFDAPDDVDAVVQDRRMQFDITCVSRSLKDHGGMYEMLETARLALAGYRIPGFGKCVPVRDRLVGYKAGVWYYALTIAIATVAVELDEEEVLPTLERVTAVSRDTTSEIPS